MLPKQIWQATLGELQLQTSRPNYETWLRNTWAISQQGDVFTVGVPSTFAKEWLETRFLTQIRRTLGGIVGRPMQVSIVVGQQGTGQQAEAPSRGAGRERASRRSRKEAKPLDLEPAEEEVEEPEPAISPAPASSSRGWPDASPDGWAPNSRYTFESFVVGPSNQLAYSAAKAVATNPANAYNPLFIYGGVGLGKTHLLHAIAHVIQQSNRKAVYVSSERFLTDLINAIEQKRTEEFRAHYRTADVLLIDDIQFIAGKEFTQVEFFHTFNDLHGSGRQIVLSSDRPPRSMMTLEERLRSRFEWGLIADVQPPDLETRAAILRAKRATQPIPVPDDVLTYIAQQLRGNIRELEGSLNRVVAYASLRGQPVTLNLATDALADLLAIAPRRYLTASAVLDAVTRHYRVDLRALRGKQRDKSIVLPRQVAMYLLHKDLEMPLTEIGRELGGRDHSTVLHGVEKVKVDVEADAQLRKDISSIREALYNAARA